MVYTNTLISGPANGFSIERRSVPRFTYMTNLQFLSTGGAVPGIVRDVSADGLFVEIEEPYTVGKRIDLRFVLRSSRYAMNLTGEVVRKTTRGIALKLV